MSLFLTTFVIIRLYLKKIGVQVFDPALGKKSFAVISHALCLHVKGSTLISPSANIPTVKDNIIGVHHGEEVTEGYVDVTLQP